MKTNLAIFRNYKSCKSNINLIILNISSLEAHLVCWSWLQSWCLLREWSQVQRLVMPLSLIVSK